MYETCIKCCISRDLGLSMAIVRFHFNHILISPCDFYSASDELTRFKKSSQIMQFAYWHNIRKQSYMDLLLFCSNRTSWDTYATCLWLLQAWYAFWISYSRWKTVHTVLPQCIRPLLFCLPQEDPCPVAERWVLSVFLGFAICRGQCNVLSVFSEKLLRGHPSLVFSFNHCFLTHQIA